MNLESSAVRTCADEQHVVGPLVQAADPVHHQPGEVDPLGEQQGASQSFVLHQRVLLGEVERGVRQLQGAVVAILSVGVSYTLQHGGREEGGNEHGGKGGRRGRRRAKKEKKLEEETSSYVGMASWL